MKKKSFLIIDQDEKFANLLMHKFQLEGYDVDAEYTGDAGYSAFENKHYDLVLIDMLVPNMNCIEIIKRIRKKSQSVLIIVFLPKEHIQDKIYMLEHGATTYSTKPVNAEELLARIKNIFAITSEKTSENLLTHGNLTLDLNMRVMMYNDQELSLTKTEFDLLAFLIKHKNKVQKRGDILKEIWGYSYIDETNIVDVYVKHIRSKIDERFNDKIIYTIRGVGYLVKDTN